MTPTFNQNPYPGPRPFEEDEQNRFFGRAREISDLTSLITAHQVVLLYAQSGAGKTSLLNAGVIPQLKKEGFAVLPIARVGTSVSPDIQIQNIYVYNVLGTWAESTTDLQSSLTALSLWDFIQRREHPKDKRGFPLPLVAIFDQFEELFTSYPERWQERDKFFDQVAVALTRDPLFRCLFVIREDFLANLDPHADLLPDRLRTRYRLNLLDADAARLAIEKPLEGTGYAFGEGVAEELVKELGRVRSVGKDAQTSEVAGQYIEPLSLQVVCRRLWDTLPPEVTTITSAHRQAYANVDEALTEYYETSISTVLTRRLVDEKRLRDWFDKKLITPARTRGTVFQGENATEGIPNKVVKSLEDNHLVRAETRMGGRWYELTHDRFVSPILESNREWFKQFNARGRKKVTSLTVVCTIAVLLFVFISFWSPTACFVFLQKYSPGAPQAIATASALGRWEIIAFDSREFPPEEGWKTVQINIAVENKTYAFGSPTIKTAGARVFTDSVNSYPVETFRTTGTTFIRATEISFLAKIPHGYRMKGEYRGDAVVTYVFQAKIPVGSKPKSIQIPGYTGEIQVYSNPPLVFPRDLDFAPLRAPNYQTDISGQATLTVGKFDRKPGASPIHDRISATITVSSAISATDTILSIRFLPIGDDGIVGAAFTEAPDCQPKFELGPGQKKESRICAIIPHTAKKIQMIFFGDINEVYDTQAPDTAQ